MPKELTHLIVSEAARQSYSAKTSLGEMIERHLHVYRFGAVMHDIPFCASSSKHGIAFKEKGYEVHGTTDLGPIRPFIYLGSVYDKTGDPNVLALIAGAVTHMMADVVFHPFVYYYTGESISRHYRIETLIDTHLSGRQGIWFEKPVTTRGFYRHLKGKNGFLSRHLSGFFGLSDPFFPEITKALNMHAFALRLFRSRAGYHLFRMTALVGSKSYRSKTNLFYPSKMRFHSPFFQSEFVYRHPVTGEPSKATLESLVDTAVQKACGIFEEIQEAVDHRGMERFFSGFSPVSLETGLAPSAGKTFRYTDLSKPIDRLVSAQGKDIHQKK